MNLFTVAQAASELEARKYKCWYGNYVRMQV